VKVCVVDVWRIGFFIDDRELLACVTNVSHQPHKFTHTSQYRTHTHLTAVCYFLYVIIIAHIMRKLSLSDKSVPLVDVLECKQYLYSERTSFTFGRQGFRMAYSRTFLLIAFDIYESQNGSISGKAQRASHERLKYVKQ
jgi:hypothetical protein